MFGFAVAHAYTMTWVKSYWHLTIQERNLTLVHDLNMARLIICTLNFIYTLIKNMIAMNIIIDYFGVRISSEVTLCIPIIYDKNSYLFCFKLYKTYMNVSFRFLSVLLF